MNRPLANTLLAERPGATQAPKNPSLGESDNGYGRVVRRLNDRWRVVECRDGIQWILQHGKSSGHGTAWRGRSYCRTKSALIRSCAQQTGEIDPVSLAILDTLPSRIGNPKAGAK